MIFRTHNTTVAICDGCGPGWWKTTKHEQPTLPSNRRATIRVLTEDHGWRIRRRLFRRTQMHCPACAPLQACTGHVWEPQTYIGAYGSFLVCDRCGHVADYLDVPPAGHPESMTKELSAEHEEWLAALDVVLDSDRANEEV